MAPTFCSRCGHLNAVEERCDPRDELAELDALLEHLKLKRYELKRKINQLQSPIVRQLLPDIMSTIFEFCLPDFTYHQPSPFAEENLSIPLSLGAICSYWRDIAWSTPSLWSSLVVRVTRKHNPHIVASIAHEWLSRSGQLPLSIRICSELHNHGVVPALADIINRYSTRWSDLDLYTPESYYQHFRASDNHAPILKSIRFNCSAYAVTKNFRLTCPRLERAVFSHIYLNGINIQWDNLTHLTLHSMLIEDSFLILRKTSRLVFCKVSCYCSGHRSIGPLVLTSLKSLQLMTDVGDYLSNLITPHLEEFSLRDCNIPSIVSITSFLQRSACSLRSFFITLSAFRSFDDFMILLHTMPSLHTLSITNTDLEITYVISHGDYDPRNILQLLAKALSSQSTSLKQGFLPNLKIFEYTGKLNLRPEYFDDLHSLLPAYINAVHGPLQLIKIDLTQRRIPRKMISYFSSFVERGVTVHVTSESEDIIQTSESIDYSRRRGDFFCRDWADNFDSSLFS